MAAPYTHRNLDEVEDSAPKFGYEDNQEARFANKALETEQSGLSFHRVKPGKRQAFAHKHDDAEEVYVILSGSVRTTRSVGLRSRSPKGEAEVRRC